MQFGVCGNFEVAAVAKQTGYDFSEWTVTELLKPRQPDTVFTEALEAVHAAALPYPVANGFIPGDLKITGPQVDEAALRDYVMTVMQRARQAGIEVIVFGSGGARQIPEGCEPVQAHQQLVNFCTMAAPLAQDHGVTIAVEPLNVSECNVLTTVDECARLVHEVAHPGFRLLVDAYHLMKDNDAYKDIVTYAGLLVHVHLATVPNRRTPGAEPCDLSPFFKALAKAGYTGRVSIEARLQDPETELPPALEILRRLAAG